MSKKAYVFLADGFEDVEALIPVDVLRRGGIEVVTVAVKEEGRLVTSAHGVTVVADSAIGESRYDDADLVLLPGGMPGASNLFASDEVRHAALSQHEAGRLVAAICAAPAVVLAPLGILHGKRATCYPGFEEALADADYQADLVASDDNVVTAEGPAAAFPFAYELLARLSDQATADQVAEGMRYKHLMQCR